MVKKWMLSPLLVTLLLACDVPPDAGPVSPSEAASPLLLANTADVWPTHTIDVCFDSPSDTMATRRDWARQAIEGSWQRYSDLRFQGWGTCKAGQAGIHLAIGSDTHTVARTTATTEDVGFNTVNAIAGGVTLNLNLTGLAACDANDTTRKNCITNLIVHEFGHALGFRHSEGDSTATPPAGCSDPDGRLQNPATPGRRYGAYTSQSIMSSCWAAPTSCWDDASCPTHLFPIDIAGVQRLYGRHLSGSMVTAATGQCLSWGTSDPSLQACVGVVRRDWTNNNLYTFITTGSRSFNVGLTLPNGNTANGTTLGKLTPLIASDPNEKWTFTGVQLRGYGGLCLDLAGGDTTNGNRVQTWDCNALGGSNQRWDIDTSRRIHFGGTNKCLTYTTTMNNGEGLFIQDCGAPNQVFSFNADGSIQFTSGGFTKCMDVQDVRDADFLAGSGSPRNGAPVQTYICLNPQINQRWNITGPIHFGSTAKCINNPKSADAVGSSVEIRDCNGAADEEWDYYY
jgi:Ricin-type beta-trefoil lectin domain/Dual-action HEIGH metallo-peptidase